MPPGKTKVKQGKFTDFISKEMKDYFREMCKSQNINLISPTLKFNLGIIQFIFKILSTIVVLSSLKIYLSVQFQYLTFQLDQESGVCVRSKFFFLYVGLYFFPFNLICNYTTFRNYFLPFNPTPPVEVVCKDNTCACMMLYALFPLIWYATWHDAFRRKYFDLLTPP